MPNHPTRRSVALGLAAATLLAAASIPLLGSSALAAESPHPTSTISPTSGTRFDDLGNFSDDTTAKWTATDLICPAGAKAAGFLAQSGAAIQTVTTADYPQELPGYFDAALDGDGAAFPVDETGSPVGAIGVNVGAGTWYGPGFAPGGLPSFIRAQALNGVTSLDLGLVCIGSDDLKVVLDGSNKTIAAWTTLTVNSVDENWSVPAPAPAKIDTAVTVSATPPSGGSTTLAAVISTEAGTANDATGTVEFFDNTGTPTSVGTASVTDDGLATKTLTGLTVGTHSYSATYTPAEDNVKYNGSSSTADATITVVPAKIDSTVSLAGAAKGDDGAIFTATVKANGTTATAATGTVEFWSDGAKKGEGALTNGVATYTATGLTPGQTYGYTARYAGDTAYNAAAESAEATVTLPDAPTELNAGDQVTPGTTYVVNVPAGTFTAGATISGEIHSDPIPLTETATAGTDGSAVYTFTAPDSLPSGDHELVLTSSVTTDAPFTLAFIVAAAAPTDDPGTNPPLGFATDWIASAASTPAGLAGLIGTLVLVLGGGTAGGWLYLRRRQVAKARA